ncbi:MAG: alkaline phosphatase family protein [Bdellovibrionota bacterium]
MTFKKYNSINPSINPWSIKLLIIFSLILSSAPKAISATIDQSATYLKKPKLILVLVIDQFRADYLTRFEARFLPAKQQNGDVGGFRYLMSKGAYFPFAEYDITQSMTGPGHATVLTGAYPYQMGIPVNYWFNQETKELEYCVSDKDNAIIGKSQTGISPKNLIGTTVGDELKNAGYPSRVVGIAIKDRAAVLMAGHRADVALWFDRKTNEWVSSRYYFPDGILPKWVNELNEEIKNNIGKPLTWPVPSATSGLSIADMTPYFSREELTDKSSPPAEIGSSFPHKVTFGSPMSILFPFGFEITADAAGRALDALKLGQTKATDILAVSFSSHDYMGHAFGPNSLEMEETTIIADRTISRLLNHVKKRLPNGLSDAVIVFTGDHGSPPSPTWAKANKLPAGLLDEQVVAKSLTQKLDEKFGKPANSMEWLVIHDFNIYIDRKTLAAKKIPLTEIESELKQNMLGIDWVAHVITSTEYNARILPPGIHGRQVMRTYFPGRSGDMVIIPKPFFIPNLDGAATHITGYVYDRTVPLIFSGLNIKAGIYATRAEIVDVAPTLSFLLGIIPPSCSEGRVLNEALTLVGRK